MFDRRYIVKREKGSDEHFKLVPATWYESMATGCYRSVLKKSKMRSGESAVFSIPKSKYACLEKDMQRGLDVLQDAEKYPDISPMHTEALKYYHGYYDNRCYSVKEIEEKLDYSHIYLPDIPEWADLASSGYSISHFYDLNGIEKQHFKSVDFKQVIYNELITALTSNSNETTFLKAVFRRYGMSVSNNENMQNNIAELGLSVRAYNCLKRSGITTITQLLELSESDLLAIRNMGRKATQEILKVQNELIGTELSPIEVHIYHHNTEHIHTCNDRRPLEIAKELYEVIVNEILHAGNETIFEYTMSSELENFLLLKGYLLIEDVLEHSEKLQSELQIIGLDECALHLEALTKAITEYKKWEERFTKDSRIEILDLSDFGISKLIECSEEGKCYIGRLRKIIEEDIAELERLETQSREADEEPMIRIMYAELQGENKADLYTLSVFENEDDFILLDIEEASNQ